MVPNAAYGYAPAFQRYVECVYSTIITASRLELCMYGSGLIYADSDTLDNCNEWGGIM